MNFIDETKKDKHKKAITLSSKVIEDIKPKNGKTKINKYDEELNCFIKYTYKNKTPNNYFFS